MLNSVAQVRALLGVKRLSGKKTLEDISVEVCGAIQNRRYDGSYPWALYSAAYGVAHGFATGRVDGTRYQALNALTGDAAVKFLLSIADKELTGDDVSRYLNGRRFAWDGSKWKAVY